MTEADLDGPSYFHIGDRVTLLSLDSHLTPMVWVVYRVHRSTEQGVVYDIRRSSQDENGALFSIPGSKLLAA